MTAVASAPCATGIGRMLGGAEQGDPLALQRVFGHALRSGALFLEGFQEWLTEGLNALTQDGAAVRVRSPEAVRRLFAISSARV